MLNYIWGIMMIIGIGWGAFHGQMAAVTNGALEGAKDAVTLCITMLGIMTFWSGLLEVARQSGVIERMTKGMEGFVNFMFPEIPKGHPARLDISTNIIANMLGLGWAATPAGLSGFKHLQELNPDKSTASKSMCTFMILNISSLELIPVSMLAYRSQFGSVNPSAIIVPAIIATSISTAAGILFCKVVVRK